MIAIDYSPQYQDILNFPMSPQNPLKTVTDYFEIRNIINPRPVVICKSHKLRPIFRRNIHGFIILPY